ncbi:carbonic anhydrase 2-like [Saccostrea cucullata]|uniref:carbonic anhydrase 2-like n=1 Tax=Saccostrea cuccullata TaxID=36930 RepID=UPI002ED575F2
MAPIQWILIILSVFALSLDAAEWHYSGEHGIYEWPNEFEQCGEVRQSPIDFPKVEDMTYSKMTPIEFHGFDDPTKYRLKLENNGHTVKVSIESGDVYIEGGGLPGRFKTAQFHFHWGHSGDEGSEHTFDGHNFPMELHVVNYNEKYGNISNAATQDGDGLAVLGFWYQVSDHDNYALAPLINELSHVPVKGSKMDLTNVNLGLLLPIHMDEYNPHFYRYSGSLTTPPCFQSVVWTVFDNKMPISSAQLHMFQTLHEDKEIEGDHYLIDNYRPTQPLNGRIIYRNFEVTSTGPVEQQHQQAQQEVAKPKRKAKINVRLHLED